MIRLALFFLVLFLAAVFDIRKRIIPDWMPFLIAGVSLIPSEPVYLTGLFVALPLLIAGITVGGIGGGDIKLTGACGLVLGFERTLAGLLMALMFLLLFHWAGQCIRKCKKINCGVGKEQAYPLVPFLLVGMGGFGGILAVVSGHERDASPSVCGWSPWCDVSCLRKHKTCGTVS